MTDYISRGSALAFQCEVEPVMCKSIATGEVFSATPDAALVKFFNSLPAADVVPKDFHERCLQIEIQKRMAFERKRGEWKDGLSAYGTYIYKICSVCECVYIRKSNFCPNCGADMREES